MLAGCPCTNRGRRPTTHPTSQPRTHLHRNDTCKVCTEEAHVNCGGRTALSPFNVVRLVVTSLLSSSFYRSFASVQTGDVRLEAGAISASNSLQLLAKHIHICVHTNAYIYIYIYTEFPVHALKHPRLDLQCVQLKCAVPVENV